MDDQNQYLNQPTQPLNQSTNQPVNQPMNQQGNQPVNQPANQPGNQPENQPVQPSSQYANQPANPVGQTLKKWPDLHGIAIVSLGTGAKLGSVDDFYFDSSTTNPANQIRGLRIKTGMFSHHALPLNAIKAIGTDAITVDNEDALLNEKDEQGFSTLPLGQGLLSYKVMSEGGTLLGNIGNILFDVSNPSTLFIYSYELAGGLRNRISGHYSTFYAQQVLRYGQDVIVIPDAVAVELSR